MGGVRGLPLTQTYLYVENPDLPVCRNPDLPVCRKQLKKHLLGLPVQFSLCVGKPSLASIRENYFLTKHIMYACKTRVSLGTRLGRDYLV